MLSTNRVVKVSLSQVEDIVLHLYWFMVLENPISQVDSTNVFLRLIKKEKKRRENERN